MDGPATDCDQCRRDIVYGETCYAMPDGSMLDGLPVVRVLCDGCYAAGGGTLEEDAWRTV